MRFIWVKSIIDLVALAPQVGIIFYYGRYGRHLYYLRAGSEQQIFYLVAELPKAIPGSYIALNEEGHVRSSKTPIIPICARITEVLEDEVIEEFITKHKKVK